MYFPFVLVPVCTRPGWGDARLHILLLELLVLLMVPIEISKKEQTYFNRKKCQCQLPILATDISPVGTEGADLPPTPTPTPQKKVYCQNMHKPFFLHKPLLNPMKSYI